jgi:pyruvate ferredoxin oxidoreductase alpha subunit
MPVETIDDSNTIKEFLPPYKPHTKLDPEDPCIINLVTFPWIRHDPDKPGIEKMGAYPEFRFKLQESLLKVPEKFNMIDKDFGKRFGREYGIYKQYRCDDAEFIIFGLGTIACEARISVDILREEGYKVGVLSLKLYRPFPRAELIEFINTHPEIKGIIVFDRNLSYGYEGAVCTDLKGTLYTAHIDIPIHNYLAGIGGRDVTAEEVAEAAKNSCEMIMDGKIDKETEWINIYSEE